MNRIFKNRAVIAGISLALAIILGIAFYSNVNSSNEKVQVIKVISAVLKRIKITENMVNN